MILYLIKMWAAVIGVVALLCWPLVFFAWHTDAYMIWIPIMFGWLAFVFITLHMAIMKDMPGPFDVPVPPQTPNLDEQ